MQDVTHSSLASNLGMLHARGAEAPSRTGNRHGGLGISLYNVYRTSDAMSCSTRAIITSARSST
jgi:formyl-CoA transferase